MAIKEIQFKECSWTSVKHLFLNYHYLKTMPAGIMAVYGLFRDDVECLGGIVFCNGRIQYDGKYLEFSRMYVDDSLGKNTESNFIGKALKALQKKYPNYEGVVTWADLNRGHSGIIYRASNFIFDGKSRNVKKYLGKSKKTIYQRTSTPDSVCIGEDSPKLRFIYYFNSKKRELLRKQIEKRSEFLESIKDKYER